ncbi:hypothetical protein TNCV_415651 [Trichonephila clavipes]|nr:hypothetical protein TNCV_415651 [Trichonephila clavipes]
MRGLLRTDLVLLNLDQVLRLRSLSDHGLQFVADIAKCQVSNPSTIEDPPSREVESIGVGSQFWCGLCHLTVTQNYEACTRCRRRLAY